MKKSDIIINQVKRRIGLELEKYDDEHFVLRECFDNPYTYVFILEDEEVEDGEILALNYVFNGFYNNQYRIIGIEPLDWEDDNYNEDEDGGRDLFTLDRDDIIETYYYDQEEKQVKRIIIFKTKDARIRKSASDLSDTFTLFSFMMMKGLDKLIIHKSLSFDEDYEKYSDPDAQYDEEFFKA